MGNRIVSKGVYVQSGLSDLKTLRHITSFGSTGNTLKEKEMELGYDGYYIPNTIPEVTISLEAREFGTADNLSYLLGLATPKKYINFERDIEDKVTNLRVPVEVDNSKYWTQLFSDVYITSYNLSYTVDGAATESYSLRGDNREIHPCVVYRVEAKTGETAATATISDEFCDFTADCVTSVKVNGKEIEGTTGYTVSKETDGSLVITAGTEPAFVAGDELLVEVSCVPKKLSKRDGSSSKRRGEVEVYLVKATQAETVLIDEWNKASPDGSNTLYKMTEKGMATKYRIGKIQTLNLDVGLEREDLNELGRTKPYFRALNVPLNITSNMDFIASDNEVLAYLMGEESLDTMDTFDISKLDNDLGLMVYVYDEWDIDRAKDAKPIKVIELPKITITDENFNAALESNATQSMSLLADNGCIYIPSIV